MKCPSWPLDGLKVVEYAQFVSGPYCGKMLAEMGAEVIKVEPPEGDVSRRRGPFPGDTPHPEQSALFLYLNTNKLGVTLNLDTSAGRKLFLELLQNADVLVEDCAPGYMDELGIGYGMLAERNTKLVITSITPFGQSGPYRDYKAYYLNTFHAGGEGYCLPGGQGSSLPLDREPLRVGAFAGESFCGLVAAAATTVAVMRQLATGAGEHLDISKQEALIHVENRIGAARYPNEGIIESRATRSRAAVGARDGFLVLGAIRLTDEAWRQLMDRLGWPEWSRTEELQSEAGRERREAEVRAHITEWLKGVTKHEGYNLLQSVGVFAAGVETPEDILSSPQLKARGYFLETEHQVAGRLPYAGLPFELSGHKRRRPEPAPLLGQHNELVLCERMGHTKGELVRLRTLNVI